MSAPYQRLGNYVLLRELAQDGLGSTHRAGLVSGGAIGDLLLLRRFPPAVAGPVAAAIASRRTLSEQLRSPFLGELRDTGSADGSPFLAYEYRPGVTGAQLLTLADSRMSPLGPELATVVADRAAQALLAVWSARSGPALLVPELLWISTEGEVRLLGAEAAPGLRWLAATLPGLLPFLSPETRRGEGQPGEADDVWALGALLTALLTGKAPPPDPDEGGAWLAHVTLAEDEAPMPEPLADLLGRSLVPRSQRLSKVEAWQKALGRAVEMLGWRVSPFQLAVFMHALCKAEMAREPREVEREREEALRPAPAPPVAAAPASPPPPAPVPMEVPLPAMSSFSVADDEAPRSGKRGLLVAAAIAAVVLGGGAWWLTRGSGEPTEPAATAAPTASPAPAAAPTAAAAATPSSDELENRLAALMAEREKSLSEHYSQEIEQLRSQLQDTRRQESAKPAAAPPPRAPSRAEPLPSGQVASQPVAMPVAVPPPAPAAAAPAAAAPAPAAAPPAAAQAPASSSVSDSTAPLVPAKLLGFEPPEYPLVARRQRVEGTVVLSLHVDAAGKVGEVRFLRKVAQDVGINEAAATAARRARFAPATRGGAPVESWYTLTIPFQL